MYLRSRNLSPYNSSSNSLTPIKFSLPPQPKSLQPPLPKKSKCPVLWRNKQWYTCIQEAGTFLHTVAPLTPHLQSFPCLPKKTLNSSLLKTSHYHEETNYDGCVRSSNFSSYRSSYAFLSPTLSSLPTQPKRSWIHHYPGRASVIQNQAMVDMYEISISRK